ncbi:histamine H2 receptor-like [Gigantopelta aegis]|uniref:histamine H2 receptor-like n=1 Tax=Gigantopelta aegis TaxID=1735272 RepID=UPI001B88B884|nr:histamine H2 receptor-like [Gigantopelta aegis]
MESWNTTSQCASASHTEFVGRCVLLPIIMCLLAVFICGGNMMTILAVYRNVPLQTNPNMYVVSLAVADLIVGVYVFFDSFWYNALTEDDIAHCTLCNLSNLCAFYTSLFASMVSLVLISADRFLYICYPFQYEYLVTRRKIQTIIIATWIISVTLGTFPIYFDFEFDMLPVWYEIYLEKTIFASVFVITLVLYAGIVKTARRQLKSIEATTVDPAHSRSVGKNWKGVRLMLLVCGGFFVCWCPYHLCIVISHVSYVSEDVLDALFPLGILNSGVNFVIYALMNRDFRAAFYRIISSVPRCCREHAV